MLLPFIRLKKRYITPGEITLPILKTYITGGMSGSFGSDNRDGIRLEVVAFSDQILPGIFVVVLK